MREESGAIAIIVALLMVALLTVVALVIDLGGLYDHDRELQTAADAGALAGAQELVLSNGDQTAVATKTSEYVFTNTDTDSKPNANVDVNGDNVTVTTVIGDRSVTVDLREDSVPFLFAPVIGKTKGSVVAHAKAEVKYVTEVANLFPVALLIMNPEKFRFVFHTAGNGPTVVGTFDITDAVVADGWGDGVFGDGSSDGDTLPAAAPGLYYVDLQAITYDADGHDVVALELNNVGLWWVSDPTNPTETLLSVGMSRLVGADTVSVRAVVAATVTGDTLAASLGKKNDFSLLRVGDTTTFTGSVAAPTATDSNTGYGLHDLVIGGVTCGRYIAFHPDVPLKYLMMTGASFYAGYSRQSGGLSEHQSATIVTKIPIMWDEYTMKLGNQAGSGLYSGNWRLADIFAGQNTNEELGEMDPAVLDTWELNTPLSIGGPLWPGTGAKVGQVWQGLDDRKAAAAELADRDPNADPEAWREVIVPFVNYDPDLSGTSRKYVINMFAAFRIDSYSSQKGHKEEKGEISGQFIRWVVAPVAYSDEPGGPLYVETAVLTE